MTIFLNRRFFRFYKMFNNFFQEKELKKLELEKILTRFLVENNVDEI